MADKKVKAGDDAEVVIQRAKSFWAKFSKPIIYIGGGLILLGAAYLGYKYFYKIPKEEKAEDAIIAVERIFGKLAVPGTESRLPNFAADSGKVILNGGPFGLIKVTGTLEIIRKYGGTPAANRAHYMAGVYYIHLKDYNNALKQLKEFDPEGTKVAIPYYISMATAYAELKKNDDAFAYYKKAALFDTDDDINSPIYMKLAADFANHTGKGKEALELYQRIKDDYPVKESTTQDVRAVLDDVDKELARLGKTD